MKKIITLLCCSLFAWQVCAQPVFEVESRFYAAVGTKKWMTFDATDLNHLLFIDSSIASFNNDHTLEFAQRFSTSNPNGVQIITYLNKLGNDSLQKSYRDGKLIETEISAYDSLHRLRYLDRTYPMGNPELTKMVYTLNEPEYGPKDISFKSPVTPILETEHAYFKKNHILSRSEVRYDNLGNKEETIIRHKVKMKNNLIFEYQDSITNGRNTVWQIILDDMGYYLMMRPYKHYGPEWKRMFQLSDDEQKKCKEAFEKRKIKRGIFLDKTIAAAVCNADDVQKLVSRLDQQDSLTGRQKANLTDHFFRYHTAKGNLQLLFYYEGNPARGDKAGPRLIVYIEQTFQQR